MDSIENGIKDFKNGGNARNEWEHVFSGAQLGQTSKTRQKLDWKFREIDGSYLCLQQLEKFWTLWPETEAIWICWNQHEKNCETTLVEYIFGFFGPMCGAGGGEGQNL